MKWDAVFFDFDGVILDSANIKTRAFAQMFSKYGPEIEKKVIDYHLSHSGISRMKKIEHFYSTFLSSQLNQNELYKLCEQFSNIVFKKVLSCPMINGAMETLTLLKKNNILSFVLSGTPQDELNKIIQLRKLKNFFVEIFGSPMKKEEMLAILLDRYDLLPEKCLFVGDATTDLKAAKAYNIPFLGIVPDLKHSPFPDNTWIKKKVCLNKE